MNWKNRYHGFKVGDMVELQNKNHNIARKMRPNDDWEPSNNYVGNRINKVFEDGTFTCYSTWPIYNPIAFKKVEK